jgi:hypothetical protein
MFSMLILWFSDIVNGHFTIFQMIQYILHIHYTQYHNNYEYHCIFIDQCYEEKVHDLFFFLRNNK